VLKITIQNLDNAIRRLNNLADTLEENTEIVLENVAEKVYNNLWTDETIPEEWRYSLKIAVVRRFWYVVGPVWEVAELLERGDVTRWLLYRCPALRYLGGKIRRPITAKRYMERYWQTHKSEILQMLRAGIVRLLRRAVR